MTTEFLVYLILGIILLIFSLFLLITLFVQIRLREKYSIFTVKFCVDLITSISLIALGALDRTKNERTCGASLVISTSVPLLQGLLLLSEVIDFSLAAFSPVYFHNSSLLSRVLPFIAGAASSAVILTALIVIDSTTNANTCITSPEATAVISVYDFSLGISTVCVTALAVLLLKNLNSDFFEPIVFHFITAILFQECPLLICILFKYTKQKSAIISADAANWCFGIHALLHSIYFIVTHKDYVRGIRNTFFEWRISSSFRRHY